MSQHVGVEGRQPTRVPIGGMTDSTLHQSQSRLAGHPNDRGCQCLGGDTMLLEADNGPARAADWRLDEIMLLDYPADATDPRSINVYRVDVQDFATRGGKKFKLDPQCLLYCLEWQHNGTPPDFHLQLVRDPQECSVSSRRCCSAR